MRVRRYVIANHGSPPRTSVIVLHVWPVFHEVSSVEYQVWFFFSRHTATNRRGQPSTLRRCSNEHDELCLFRAVRRTKVGAEASLPRVPLLPRVVLRPCAQLQKRQGSARPLIAALRSLVVSAGFSAAMRWSLHQTCATCRLHSTCGHMQPTPTRPGGHARATAVGASVDWALFSKGR